MVAYLLAIPSFALFLAGWFSVSPFALIGGTRVLTQLFAYEVPFFLALLTPGRAGRQLADRRHRPASPGPAAPGG